MILSCGHEYENGSGRRKRCPACAREAHLEQLRVASRAHHLATYEHKRRTL